MARYQPKISLCVIAGREEKTIKRFLDSFEGAFDEFCLVIATGCKPPDDTEKIAREWCAIRGLVFNSETYLNRADAETWPHVDDFAKARNVAFNSATGDWIIWGDCDDVFTGKASDLRAIADSSHDIDVHHFGYDVANAGKLVSRERLIRRSILATGASWHGAIHENFRARTNHKHKRHDLTWWRHEPLGEKARSSERNLTILSAELSNAPAYMFYTHQDFFLQGRKDKAKKWGEIFLSCPVSDKSLRYQTHLNLSALATDHSTASRHALAAFWLYPHREALVAMVNCAFQENDAEKAVYFANLLNETPMPNEPLWCHEPRWYGWHGRDLLWRAERLAGVFDRGLYRESLVLVHETTADDLMFVQTRDLWMTAATNPDKVFHVFALPDDEIGNKWFLSFARIPKSQLKDFLDGLPSEVEVVKISSNDVPTPGWDEKGKDDEQ